MKYTNVITSQIPQLRQRASRVLIALGVLAFASLLPVEARADHGNNILVTYHRYDGQVGHDANGGHLYRVKVHHGHHYYYIYLHQPLPQLRGHMHEKVPVQVGRNDRWITLSIHGHSARIHKVVTIGHD